MSTAPAPTAPLAARLPQLAVRPYAGGNAANVVALSRSDRRPSYSAVFCDADLAPRLIASADLLGALVLLADAVDCYGVANLDTDDLDAEARALQRATERARAAIAKALGPL